MAAVAPVYSVLEEVRRRAEGAAGGQAARVRRDHLRRRVSVRGRTQAPGVIRLHVQRLRILPGVHVGSAGGSVGSPHPPPPPVVSLLKHVLTRGVQHPVVALLVPSVLPGDFHEAFVKR